MGEFILRNFPNFFVHKIFSHEIPNIFFYKLTVRGKQSSFFHKIYLFTNLYKYFGNMKSMCKKGGRLADANNYTKNG